MDILFEFLEFLRTFLIAHNVSFIGVLYYLGIILGEIAREYCFNWDKFEFHITFSKHEYCEYVRDSNKGVATAQDVS